MQKILSDVKREVSDWRSATGLLRLCYLPAPVSVNISALYFSCQHPGNHSIAKGKIGGRGWVGLSVVHLGDRDVRETHVEKCRSGQAPHNNTSCVFWTEGTERLGVY